MITRIVAGLLVAAGLTVVPATPPATAGLDGPEITVANMQFSPATATAPLSSVVTWSFPEAMGHTTTSTQGFWDSGTQSGGDTFTVTFHTAGSYPYRCSIHPSMRGTIRVPMQKKGSPAAGWKLRWSTADIQDTSYDVQVRKGSGKWTTFRKGTFKLGATFKKPGSWTVRARTHAGSSTSSWSPPLKVRTARS